MRKIAVILILTAVAVFCATQIETDLILSNGTPIRVTVPEGAFEGIDSMKSIPFSDSNDGPPSPKRAKIETNIPLVKSDFDNESEFEQFRKLWNIDSPAPAQEQTSLTEDISADMFVKSLLTANYLMIQGEYSKRFSKNMVKYGLLGAHSADIIASEIFSGRPIWSRIFGDFLQAFLEQTGFNYRVTRLSTGQLVLFIEKDDIQSKKINYEYIGASQKETYRTVLYSELGPTGSQEKRRNEAVLSWLLWNIGGSSVDIQYFADISSEEALSELGQTIQNFTKEKTNKKDEYVYVEGLTFNFTQENHASLSTALRLVPDLTRLEMSINFGYTFNIPMSSLVESITLCELITALKITEMDLESEDVCILLESLPNIEKLSLCCNSLESTAIDRLRSCSKLESLELDGEFQPSTVVQELVTRLPSLKELSILCDVITLTAAESFEACTQLKKLEISGDPQPSAVVQVLVSCLPSLKDLNIECEPLDIAAAESFQACTQLKKLEIDGEFQPSAVVQVLVSCLPSLKDLNIECEPLDIAAAESFEACTKLQKLKMFGESQPSAVVQVLVSCLPSLKDLSIVCEPLDIAAAESFKACTKLQKLEMFGESQPSAVVQVLVSRLPFLKDLRIGINSADLALADALRQFHNLHSLRLSIRQYTPGFLAHYLQPSLPKLKTLTLHNSDRNNNYSEEDNRAVEIGRATGIHIDLP
ncbi:hypothetical protein NECID01_2025 [Nematocida sp. AWRm77]|nr:hypothetical protein NECID01_2025 [Nematocida sp. AWRm77]